MCVVYSNSENRESGKSMDAVNWLFAFKLHNVKSKDRTRCPLLACVLRTGLDVFCLLISLSLRRTGTGSQANGTGTSFSVGRTAHGAPNCLLSDLRGQGGFSAKSCASCSHCAPVPASSGWRSLVQPVPEVGTVLTLLPGHVLCPNVTANASLSLCFRRKQQ